MLESIWDPDRPRAPWARAGCGNPKSIALAAAVAANVPRIPRRVSVAPSISILRQVALFEKTPQVLAREIPVEAVLSSQIFAAVAVVVGALAPEQFGAGEDVVGRMPKEVDRRILPLLEGSG